VLLPALLMVLAPLGAATTAAAAPHPTAVAQDTAGLPSWWYDAMHLAQAHRQSTGKGVTVAVIDLAVDPSAADIRGTDLTLATDCLGHPVEPAGPKAGDHGTAMVTNLAGTGRGNGPGGLGVRGIAPDAAVRFYAMDNRPSTPSGFDSDCDNFNAARLVDRAVADGADIITTSVQYFETKPLEAALDRALAKDVVVVASSGRRSAKDQYAGLDYPAEKAGVVATNAIDRSSRPWSENPRALDLEGRREFPVVSAPGVDVDSSGWEPGRGWRSGGTRTGTSDAAPIVAGALALVKSKYPDATGNQLIQQLIHFTTTANRFYWDKDYGFGIVSAKRMLAHDPTRWPDVNPLLKGPQQALSRFPMSSYGSAAASADASPAASSAGAASRSDDSTSSDAAARSDDAGVPVWAGPVGVLLVVGALVLVAAGRRRGRSGPAVDAHAASHSDTHRDSHRDTHRDTHSGTDSHTGRETNTETRGSRRVAAHDTTKEV
jgi:hypothetical protein